MSIIVLQTVTYSGYPSKEVPGYVEAYTRGIYRFVLDAFGGKVPGQNFS